MGGEMAQDNVSFLHDPLAALALIDPAPIGFEKLRIVPTIVSGTFRTIEADPAGELGIEMRVATRVDARAAEREIVARLKRR
jgi:inosine-uridine nucleoside N-ribohydrolase